jgi:hypothetical protein
MEPPMPANNHFKLDDDECLFPALPGLRQKNPEQAVQFPKFWAPMSSVQNGELLTEREVPECQLGAEFQGGWYQRSQSQDRQNHGRELSNLRH